MGLLTIIIWSAKIWYLRRLSNKRVDLLIGLEKKLGFSFYGKEKKTLENKILGVTISLGTTTNCLLLVIISFYYILINILLRDSPLATACVTYTAFLVAYVLFSVIISSDTASKSFSCKSLIGFLFLGVVFCYLVYLVSGSKFGFSDLASLWGGLSLGENSLG